MEERMKRIHPVLTAGQAYFHWGGSAAGSWGEPGKIIRNNR
ncbi:MAG: hypothetical protein ACOX3Q_03010 [Clostridia bacterium]